MGHDLAEIFPNGKDKDFEQRWIRYQQACAKEIEEIISKNPIRFEEIRINETLGLYAPLNNFSKVKLEENDKPHIIKDFFRSTAGYYGIEMWKLFWAHRFTVYDKRERDSHLRISPVPKDCLDLFPAWVDVRYFER